MVKDGYRIESDSMGEMEVPETAYWGAQTQRAVLNFPISGIRFPRELIKAIGVVKSAAAQANQSLGLLDERIATAIRNSAAEVIEGRLDDHFVVDIFQTGSGTSTNMNANEVISNRANELLGGKIGDKKPVHPNDHVNMSQSSNDVIPTSIHISVMMDIRNNLVPSLKLLQQELAAKASAFDDIIKIGRTHLQDATPIRVGQEFSGYARMVELGIARVEATFPRLRELALGGTAVGTGINTHPKFAQTAIGEINQMTGGEFVEAKNHFEAQGSKDALVEVSGVLKVVATSLFKIANDIRWLGSGPRCGLGEFILPAVQPGSSIMPGKVNPVIAESVCQVAAQVTGNDLAVTIGGQSGNLDLNVMMPVIAHNILQSITLLTNVSKVFAEKCIRGLVVNRKRCEELIEKSLMLCTSLSPVIGYDRAAAIAKEAYQTGKTVRELCLEKNVLPEDELNRILDPAKMTEPGV